MSTEVPAAVLTSRVLFESASGESCCVAVNPRLLSPGGSGGVLLVLDDLPSGPAVVTVASFAEDFAPAVPGVTGVCATLPASAGRPCDPTRVAAPSFESEVLDVNVEPGVQTNLTELVIHARPFVLDLLPPAGMSVANPVDFSFKVVDALTGVEPDSIVLELTFEVRDDDSEPPFDTITKRLPLTLTPCDDAGESLCSVEGEFEVSGFEALTGPLVLRVGQADVRITAQNLDGPPQELDLRYQMEVLP
jgi:hypothetical protein